MDVVVDSNVVVSVCLAGGKLGPLTGHALHAPALLASEVSSTLREMSYRNEISVEQAREALARLKELTIEFEAPGSLADAAFSQAVDLGWAKTYDAEYVAMAKSIDLPLVTLDARLERGAAHVTKIVRPTAL